MRTTVGLRFLYGYMEEDQLHHLYKSGSTFEQAINLYLFDKELRQLIFKAIQDIEHTNCQNSYKCATQKSSCKRGITYRPDVIHYDYDRRKARFFDSTPGEFFIFFPRDWHIAKVANDGEMLLKVSLKVVFKVSLTPYPPSLPLPLRPYEQ